MLHLKLPDGPINRVDSWQSFLAYNHLRKIFNWKNPEHADLWASWIEQVKTFEPTELVGIFSDNRSFNHYN